MPASLLLGLSLAVTLAGLVALWLPGGPVVAVFGPFATGLGIANQFPLALALTRRLHRATPTRPRSSSPDRQRDQG